uniref:ELMO domain-containing protein 2 n=1 Tax=Schistocephalus solidus TaxID=70667 RepID=A0A0V0J3Z0_SCHSO
MYAYWFYALVAFGCALTCLTSRGFRKWVWRTISGKCELQRILDGNREGCRRTLALERSLSSSKDPVLSSNLRNLSLDSYVDYAMQIKRIKAASNFADAFGLAVAQIRGYQSLCEECEHLRSTAFNASDERHLNILRGLWKYLIPSEAFQLVSKRWADIGFQGTCPDTDFRGMGLLGALNLLYFAESHTALARGILSASVLSTSSYPFAIVGISLTDLLRKWLRDGELKCHFYNYVRDAPTLNDFHFAYARIF